MNLPSFPNVDLFSAGVNALYGGLIARNPSHNRGYTAAGILILACFGGIGGGVARDILLNDIPSPIRDPRYIIVCVFMGYLSMAVYRYAASREEGFRTKAVAFLKSFTLPWFAVLGAHKALDHHLGFLSAVLVGLLATTAGGVLIDLFSGVTPEVVRPCEHVVTTAVLASGTYAGIALLNRDSTHFFPITLVAVGAAFLFRVFAVREHWPQIVPLQAPTEGPSVVAPIEGLARETNSEKGSPVRVA